MSCFIPTKYTSYLLRLHQHRTNKSLEKAGFQIEVEALVMRNQTHQIFAFFHLLKVLIALPPWENTFTVLVYHSHILAIMNSIVLMFSNRFAG